MIETKANPFEIIHPNRRWAPTQGQMDASQNAYEKLLPPLVHKIRMAVWDWRERLYEGASDTTKALLKYWFFYDHKVTGQPFSFFFAQREAIESIIYLYEIAKAKDKYDLLRFDSSGRVSSGMFDENWPRYVVKMATGTGKTKVMGLTLVWSYFHKLYETESALSRNFLVVAPNIIVLNRLRKDFDGLNMFRREPFIPEDGFLDRDWHSDFQPTLHIQDDLRPMAETGNIFLTNIHRVYRGADGPPSFEEEFLGYKPKSDADTAKGLDLGNVLRGNQIQDLVVLNDEAHHIHDPELEWFRSIEDISNKLKLRYGRSLSLQGDFTATPRHNNGAIFVQTISDYPLVEAIRQNVVKSPVLPDETSRGKLEEKDSSDFIERYRDFLHLGYLEWEKQFEELRDVKTPVLFVMTTNTAEADQVAAFLEAQYPLLKNAVLTIHTNRKGEIKEKVSSRKGKEELEKLRKAADEIDRDFSPYKAVVSVLMLREGWDVRNVATIVGLRPYGAQSEILPEQTLGRGLRKMFDLAIPEKLVVIGTPGFLEFVEKLKVEGVEFEYSPMGRGARTKSPIIVEVDRENPQKDLDRLDISLPRLTPRIYREYKNLEEIDVSTFQNLRIPLREFSVEELRHIVFTDIDGKFSHETAFREIVPDYRHVIAFFTRNILKESRLVGGFEALYPKVEEFIRNFLFKRSVDPADPQVLRNLSEVQAKQILYQSFKTAIDALTVADRGTAEVRDYISLRQTRPHVAENQPFLRPQKSVFNKIIGDNAFELDVAAFLDRCPDLIAFTKNHAGVGFRMEYRAENGNISDFYPDFLVKQDEKNLWIIETKGRQDLDDIRKIHRLKLWCEDVNRLQNDLSCHWLYIRQEAWEKYAGQLRTFAGLPSAFLFDERLFEYIAPPSGDREKWLAVIRRGADVSSFGDPAEWQRRQREDRLLPFEE